MSLDNEKEVKKPKKAVASKATTKVTTKATTKATTKVASKPTTKVVEDLAVPLPTPVVAPVEDGLEDVADAINFDEAFVPSVEDIAKVAPVVVAPASTPAPAKGKGKSKASPNKAINKDSGDIFFQIQGLTAKIERIQQHLSLFRKDFHSKVSLYKYVARRKTYVKYLLSQDKEKHAEYMAFLKAEKVKRKAAA